MKPSKDLDKQIGEILKQVHQYTKNSYESEMVLPEMSIRVAKQQLLALIEQREREVMERFGIKKGVEYKVFSGDKVIVLEVIESDK